MIAEALLYAATLPSTSKPHRKYIRYSVNLWSRANRCSRQWAEHETNTRRAILAAMAGCKQRRTAVVLGSGLLRDVPIRELAASFDTVVLIDLVHVATVRMKMRRKAYRNVRLIERDLSGYDALAAGEQPEPLEFLRNVPYLDLVVSANLLSQIGRGVQRQFEAERERMPEDTVEQLIAAHLSGLSRMPFKSCLVTDVSYAVIDRNGKTHEESDLMHGVAVPEARAAWAWPVVPTGEESPDYQVIHQVIAAW